MNQSKIKNWIFARQRKSHVACHKVRWEGCQSSFSETHSHRRKEKRIRQAGRRMHGLLGEDVVSYSTAHLLVPTWNLRSRQNETPNLHDSTFIGIESGSSREIFTSDRKTRERLSVLAQNWWSERTSLRCLPTAGPGTNFDVSLLFLDRLKVTRFIQARARIKFEIITTVGWSVVCVSRHVLPVPCTLCQSNEQKYPAKFANKLVK